MHVFRTRIQTSLVIAALGLLAVLLAWVRVNSTTPGARAQEVAPRVISKAEFWRSLACLIVPQITPFGERDRRLEADCRVQPTWVRWRFQLSLDVAARRRELNSLGMRYAIVSDDATHPRIIAVDGTDLTGNGIAGLVFVGCATSQDYVVVDRGSSWTDRDYVMRFVPASTALLITAQEGQYIRQNGVAPWNLDSVGVVAEELGGALRVRIEDIRLR